MDQNKIFCLFQLILKNFFLLIVVKGHLYLLLGNYDFFFISSLIYCQWKNIYLQYYNLICLAIQFNIQCFLYNTNNIQAI